MENCPKKIRKNNKEHFYNKITLQSKDLLSKKILIIMNTIKKAKREKTPAKRETKNVY